ncbi:hypothetical protein N3K66_004720 [Trichothecium roseum]|uniref:Uncharacterized protein n=1 Tax=Trichothecium roseum TaxID=47278 RepID=A0ACC0V207_9HYPO|nr:hypothetical protein N3K66_004720 [Trichothecium roseum]
MAATTDAGGSRPGASSWLALPTPIRRLFKLFPLVTYPPTPLPCRSPTAATTATASSSSSFSEQRPRLYIFSSEEDARLGRPSYNPACLKWQTLLRIAGVDVDLTPSSNHASPSGSLPFLLLPAPASDAAVGTAEEKSGSPAGAGAASVVPAGSGMLGFAKNRTGFEVPSVPEHKLEAYKALVAQAIRPAWLYALYLDPSNKQLLADLYLPVNPILSASTRHALAAAARASILRQTRAAVVDPAQLLCDARDALRALSDLLGHGGGGGEWFFGAAGPGTLDAEVFAYTHLLLDEGALAWGNNELGREVAAFGNLVEHQKRLFGKCWGKH